MSDASSEEVSVSVHEAVSAAQDGAIQTQNFAATWGTQHAAERSNWKAN